MKKSVIALIVVMIVFAGCNSTTSVKKAFILNTCVFSVDENALPIMNKMETIQKEANGGKEPEETYIMSLYVKADKNKNGKISKKEAEKAYAQYLTEIRAVVGALPFQVPGSQQ